MPSDPLGVQDATLKEVLETLKQVVQNHAQLSATVDSINGRLNVLSSIDQMRAMPNGTKVPQDSGTNRSEEVAIDATRRPATPTQTGAGDLHEDDRPASTPSSPQRKAGITSRIILTTYPGQAGIYPLPMQWGAKDPVERGPVVVGRSGPTIRRRNGMPPLIWKLGSLADSTSSDRGSRRVLLNLPCSSRG
jgi:hypothetical protein